MKIGRIVLVGESQNWEDHICFLKIPSVVLVQSLLCSETFVIPYLLLQCNAPLPSPPIKGRIFPDFLTAGIQYKASYLTSLRLFLSANYQPRSISNRRIQFKLCAVTMKGLFNHFWELSVKFTSYRVELYYVKSLSVLQSLSLPRGLHVLMHEATRR